MSKFHESLAHLAAYEAAALFNQCAAMILDEIDYGVLLVAPGGAVVYANRMARAELRGPHPLEVSDGQLRMGQAKSMAALRDAFRAASAHGQRRLVALSDGDRSVSIAIVPLARKPGDRAAPILLLLGKQGVCEKLSAHWFGVSHGLTPTEHAVLEGLLAGMEPSEIAQSHRVALSTIRTQIASLRSKTGAVSVSTLLRQVARLPPVVTTLRTGEPAAQGTEPTFRDGACPVIHRGGSGQAAEISPH